MTEEQYLLVCLIEECAEVQHRASKALRFGMSDIEPGQESDNYYHLKNELCDLTAVIQMMGFLGFTHDDIKIKKEKVLRYMTYSRNLGILDK